MAGGRTAPRGWTIAACALTCGLSFTHCTGDDPDIAVGCERDEDCGAGRTCDRSTRTCVAADAGPAANDAGDGGTGPGVIVLGQPDEYSVVETELGMGSPVGVSFENGRLLTGDYTGQRILVWNTFPATNLKRPDVVIGKANLKTSAGLTTSAQSLYPGYYCGRPVAVGGGRLLVADTNRNRAMLWNLVPTTDFRAADVVVGQTDFVSDAAKATSATSMLQPCGIAIAGNKLVVADHSNNRVLVWNTVPTTHGTAADVVLGQTDFTSNGGGNGACATANTMACVSAPSSVFSDGTRLWVADYFHNRVLGWSALPTTNATAADIVLGQPTTGAFGANTGGPSASTLAGPRDVFSAGGKLFVVDQANNRVLVWNTIPTSNGQPADVVIGQPDFASTAALHGGTGPDAKSLSAPASVASDGTRLAVADAASNRVLLWNTIPTSSFPPADVVLGRPDMSATRVRPASATTFQAFASFTDGKRFFVGEQSRVLVWDHVPTGPNDAATMVVGQTDFTTISPPGVPTERTFHIPQGLWADATHLVVADTFRHRVVVWNKALTANGQAADLVLGQATFADTTPNAGNANASATTVRQPNGVASDGTHLAIADRGNHRVLVWNTFPTSTQQAADVVLGQATMDASSPNRGATPSGGTLGGPTAVYWDGARLYVCDGDNNRVLVWKGWPTTSGQPANLVIGQPDLFAGAANNGGRSTKSLDRPSGVVLLDGHLYIGDRGNHRVLRWNVPPEADGQPADAVYGQPDFSAGEPNNGGIGPRSLAEPGVTGASPGRLWVGDSQNHRIVGIPVP